MANCLPIPRDHRCYVRRGYESCRGGERVMRQVAEREQCAQGSAMRWVGGWAGTYSADMTIIVSLYMPLSSSCVTNRPNAASM